SVERYRAPSILPPGVGSTRVAPTLIIGVRLRSRRSLRLRRATSWPATSTVDLGMRGTRRALVALRGLDNPRRKFSDVPTLQFFRHFFGEGISSSNSIFRFRISV